MVSRDEQADILGGPILQRPESGILATFSRHHFVFKLVTLFCVGLLVWVACVHGLEHLKKHRELRYRKAMRRKHGIPDSDCRPFAVAYAAAKRAHLEREAQDRKKKPNLLSDHNPPAADQRTNAQKDACLLKKRLPETKLHDYHLPGVHTTAYRDKHSEVLSLDFTDRYNLNSRRLPPIRRASRKELDLNLDHNEESRKRSFEDESDAKHETLKKSRTGVDEVNGKEEADWYAQYSGRPSGQGTNKSLGQQPESGHVNANGLEASNHVDDLHDEHHEDDEAMEGVDEDEVTGLEVVARGKKRDRAEAGSTFGGDDEEDIRNGRASHRRKRRTILQKRTEAPTRGRKRDREVESPESEGDTVDFKACGRLAHHSSKKKRGKNAASDGVSEVPVDPLCGGRRIGEDWEADGVQYKVGDKGERLRLALVKKARNKYHMPQDSQHPDRSAALEIYVETWMTDEQYKQAEIRQELAWQETSREPSGSRTPDVLDSPTKNGKNLLWDSVKCSPTHRPYRQSIPPGASTRINPFEQSHPILSRRVASSTVVSPILPGVTGSPARPGFRGFSKWEKQDREAEAMARIRAKLEEQKKAQTSPLDVPASVTAPELGSKPLPIPTITLTLAPAAEGKSDDGAQQSKSNTSTFSFVTPPNVSDSIKDIAAIGSSITPGPSSSSTSASSATPSTLFPGALTVSPTGTPSPFSFAKPPQGTPSASSAAPPPAPPNIFGKESGVGTPSLSVPSSSTLDATNQHRPPPVTESASKPVSFSFTKPDASSPSPSPAVVVPPATKPRPSTSNTASSSFPSPVTFGFTPAAAKAEAAITPESLKQATPLFSFSGASSPAGVFATPSIPSVPKFSFEQPSTAPSSPLPGSNLAPQPKPTFKFGQTLPSATDGASAAPAATDESKKLAQPVSAFSTAAGSNAPAKPSPFGVTSVFGNSTFKSPTATTDVFGKSVAVDNASSMTTPPKPSLPATSITTSESIISSTPTVAPASSGAPVFSFGGTNSSSKAAEGPTTALFGSTAAPSTAFDGKSTEGKTTFAFSASADGSKPTPLFGGSTGSLKVPSTFGSSTEGPKPTFAFGGSAETPRSASVFGGEGAKSAFTFSGAAENEASSSSALNSKPISLFTLAPKPSGTTHTKPTPGSTAFGTLTSASPFTFAKDGMATASASSSTSTQTKPAAPFNFGAPSNVTDPMFGQPPALVTGDLSQPAFGRPINATPGAFGFGEAGGSSSSTTFTFSKPAAQNQKQEQ